MSSQVADVQQNTLVIWGRNDEILNPKQAEEFASVIPRCRVEYIENCGHVGHVEQPTEVANLILGFAGILS